jgi:hypothetical protein
MPIQVMEKKKGVADQATPFCLCARQGVLTVSLVDCQRPTNIHEPPGAHCTSGAGR